MEIKDVIKCISEIKYHHRSFRKRAPNSKQETFYSFLFLFFKKIAFLGYFKKTWQHSFFVPSCYLTTLQELLYTCENTCFATIHKTQKTIYGPTY